jgi:hypothetical protein
MMFIFSFTCYLFKDQTSIGGDSFVNGGFRYWNMRRRLERHVGEILVIMLKRNIIISHNPSL